VLGPSLVAGGDVLGRSEVMDEGNNENSTGEIELFVSVYERLPRYHSAIGKNYQYPPLNQGPIFVRSSLQQRPFGVSHKMSI